MANSVLNYWQGHEGDPFRLLYDSAPILMHSIGKDGKLLEVSKFWASKLGYKREDMIGRPSTDFLTDNSRAFANEIVLPAFFIRGSVDNISYDFLRRDGSILPVLMSAVAQYDEDGEFQRSLAVFFDNTVARRAHEALEQQQRNEAIGRLVSGVAHDFNNLLSVVQGNLEFLHDDPNHPDRDTYINDALRAAKRGAELTTQLLSYGREAKLSPEETDLNEVVTTFEGMIKRLLPQTVLLETALAANLWSAKVDRSQLENAILNIVNNASDAIGDRGQITIETSNIRLTDEYLRLRQEGLAPGPYVVISITDDGCGMSTEVLRKATDPFFTTKDVSSGTGLGLSMVFGFMKQSGGAVQMYSEEDYGTTVKLYLPADESVADAIAGEDVDVMTSSTFSAEVMVVEDESDVRRVLVTQLRNAGFHVAEAFDGDTAYSMLSLDYKPKVLVTDIVMPGKLQGPELAQRALLLHPSLKVVFVSGYPDEAAVYGDGFVPEELQFVKPVDRKRFVGTVAKLLEEANAATADG